jgi:hypothetical protein
VTITLRDYQVNAAQRWAREKRTYVAFPPGSGKTLTAIAGIKEIRKEQPHLSVLVVCPAKVVPQWTKVLKSEGVDNAIVTSYQKLRHINTGNSILVIDEAHHIANRKSAQSKLVGAHASRAKYILLLSGTPTPNRPHDLWHPTWLLWGYKVVGSWTNFISYWCECETRETAPFLVQGEVKNEVLVPGKLKRDKRDEFSKWVGERMCLVSARSVLALPEVELLVVSSLGLGLKHVHIGSEGDVKITSTPTLYFTWLRESAEKFAKEHGIPFIHGGQTIAKRLKTLDKALSEGTSLVCTIDSVGEGIDGFQPYGRAVFLELAWTPAKIVQAMGRIIRLGSPHDKVTVEFLVPKGSRQERMAELLKAKMIDFGRIFGDEDVSRVANDILGGDMTDAQFDDMAAKLGTNALPDWGL